MGRSTTYRSSILQRMHVGNRRSVYGSVYMVHTEPVFQRLYVGNLGGLFMGRSILFSKCMLEI